MGALSQGFRKKLTQQWLYVYDKNMPVMPSLAEQHDAIRQWAVGGLFIKNENVVTDILGIFDDVMAKFSPRFVCGDGQAEAGQATAALVFNTNGGFDTPSRIIIGYSAAERHIVFRRQNLVTSRLREITELELASTVMQDSFGYTEEGRNGDYLHTSSNYPDLWHHKIKPIRDDFCDSMVAGFLLAVALRTGCYEADQLKYFSWKCWREWGLYSHIAPYLRRIALASFNQGVRSFLGVLDQGALRAMWKARMPCTIAYEWLSGLTEDYETFETKYNLAGADVCRRRQAAFAAQPALAWLMIGGGWENRQVTQAIDAGKPLLEAVRNAYEEKDEPLITREVLTWLRDKNHRFIDGYKPDLNPDMYHFHSRLPWLAKLPREWRPRHAREWAALESLRHKMDVFSHVTSRDTDALLHEFMAVCRNPAGIPSGVLDGKIPAGTDMWGVIARFRDKRVLELPGSHDDFFNRVGVQIVLPAIFNAAAQAGRFDDVLADERTYQAFSPVPQGLHFAGALSARIYSGLSVLKVVSLSDRWHRQVNRMDTRTNTLNENATWVPLFAPMTLPNGTHAACLVSSAALRAEGDRIGHCVGGYTHQCAVGRSHIVSLQATDGAWATTLELEETGGGKKRSLVIRQHEDKGRVRMERLPQPAQQAAQQVLDFVNKNPPDWAAIDACRAKYRADKLILKIGFDYRDGQACDDAYAAWHGAFRDLFPDATREAYLERTGIAPAIRQHFRL